MKIGTDDITKVMVGSDEVTAIYAGLDLVYSGGSTPTPPTPSGYETQYLTFVPTTAASTFQFSSTGVSYSLDSGSTWTSLAANTNTPSVAAGDKIMFKSTNFGDGSFSSSSEFDAEGNIMSLLYGDNFSGQTSLSGNQSFHYLFYYCTTLVSAENLVLPATTLTDGCYQNMFQYCTSLTTAPQLPATTLTEGCYAYMFASCTSLTVAPQLQATTLTPDCYDGMFYGCSGLTTAPVLSAATLVDGCYNAMFYGSTSLNTVTCLATSNSANMPTNSWLRNVSSTGTFYKSSNASFWSSGESGIPSNWTVITI